MCGSLKTRRGVCVAPPSFFAPARMSNSAYAKNDLTLNNKTLVHYNNLLEQPTVG